MSKILVASDSDIRTLEERDLEQVSAIERSVYNDPWSKNLIQESLRAPMTYPVGIFEGHKVLAYAIYQVIFTEGHLLNLAVEIGSQRTGLGDRLLKWVLEDAKKKGAVMIYLEVRPSNEPAKKLYERNGFRELTMRENYYSNGESALVMLKEQNETV